MSFDDDADWSNAERQAVYRLRRRKAGWVEYRRWLPPEIAAKVRAYATELMAEFDAPSRVPDRAPERKIASPSPAPSASKGVEYERVTIKFARPPGTQFVNSLRLASFQPNGGLTTWLSEFETVVGARGELRRMVEAQGGEWISEPAKDDDDDWLD